MIHPEPVSGTSRRRFLASTGGLAVGGGLAVHGGVGVALAAGDDELDVVVDGVATSVVVIPDGADALTAAAAELLVEYVEKATGATLAVTTDAGLHSARIAVDTQIHVGRTRSVGAHLGSQIDTLDPEGFLISPLRRGLRPGTDGLAIVGPTPQGTEYGVTEFLECHVGVRWLLPGPDGEDVPQTSTLRVSTDTVRQEPACLTRTMSPFHGNAAIGDAQRTWYRRNRGTIDPYGTGSRMRFLHNLSRVLPPEKYYDAHPDWYPGGKLPDGHTGWQPSMTAPGVVEAAVAEICAWFDDNPGETTFSLGTNDGGGINGGWVESDPNHPSYPGVMNHSGLLHMSEVYFTWVNQVVEGVLQQHPDKWFGCLAYHTTWQAPSFAIHPRVVPFLCDDRLTWADDGLASIGHQMSEEWAAVATTLGWYEYGWSFDYSGPRVGFAQHGEAAEYLYGLGVRYNHTEFYPNWFDGPKAWLMARHLWRSDVDVQAELTDWYERAVGAAAADDLAAFYAHWEDFWTNRVLESRWFRGWADNPYQGYRTNYVPIDDHSYLREVTDQDLALSRQWLDSAVDKAVTPAQQARAELLRHRFDYAVAAIESYPRTAAEEPTTEAEAVALIDRQAALIDAAARRDELANEFAKDPTLPTPILQSRGQDGVAIDGATFAHLVDWTRRHPDGEARARIDTLADSAEADDVSLTWARALQAVLDGVVPMNENPSFEEGAGGQADGWDFWIGGAGKGSISRTSEDAVTGSWSLLVEGLERGGPNRLAAIPGTGSYAYIGFVRAPEGTTTAGTVRPMVDLRSAAGVKIQTIAAPVVPVAPAAGRWSAFCSIFRVHNENIPEVKIICTVDGFVEGESFLLDDLSLYRLAD